MLAMDIVNKYQKIIESIFQSLTKDIEDQSKIIDALNNELKKHLESTVAESGNIIGVNAWQCKLNAKHTTSRIARRKRAMEETLKLLDLVDELFVNLKRISRLHQFAEIKLGMAETLDKLTQDVEDVVTSMEYLGAGLSNLVISHDEEQNKSTGETNTREITPE